jgi:pimeloyl-ACP methyl ester carboxylesterase
MPYADNDGIRIHYEVEGEGSPLVLQHGFTDSLETWYELGYVDALKPGRQLILVDARGHGASDKPRHTSAYTNEARAMDVVSVLRAVAIPRADYMGYSMGGWIAYALAQYAPEWVHRLIIGGCGAEGRSRIGDSLLSALRAGGADGIPAHWGAPLSSALVARLRMNDVEALMAARVDALGFSDVLPTMTMPCLLYVGAADSEYALVQETIAEMTNATFFALPGLGHAEAYLRSDLVLPQVIDFLKSTEPDG